MPLYNQSSFTFPMSLRGDYRADALLGDFSQNTTGGAAGPQRWGSDVITYSFPAGTAWWADALNYGNGEVRAGWIQFSDAQKAAARKALDAWAAVANITFVEVPDGQSVGDIRFAFTYGVKAPFAGLAYLPTSDAASAGDVWMGAHLANQTFTSSNVSRAAFKVAIPGQGLPSPIPKLYDEASAVNYQFLLHEIGHALGLSHPFATAGKTRGTAVLPSNEDNQNNTIMSYTDKAHPVTPTTPMPYDILAMQWLYGWNKTHNAGDNVYTFDSSEINFLTISDAGGIDTIKATDQRGLLTIGPNPTGDIIDLNWYNASATGPGSGSSIGFYSNSLVDNISSLVFQFRNIFIAPGVNIENAIGSEEKDTIWGNFLNNQLTGGNGSDYIDGGAGIDTSVYSQARSAYTVTKKSSTTWNVTDNFNTIDRLGASVRYSDTLTNIERLKFSDGTLAFDVGAGEVAGQAYRVYKAAFNRTPDNDGLKYWIGVMDAGATAKQVANGFIASPEFSSLYGTTPSHAVLVTKFYQNVLGRQPEADGYNYWLGLLDAGLALPNDVLAAFSESTENQVKVVGLIQDGIWLV